MLMLTDYNNINFEVCHRVLSQSVYALLSLIQAMLNMSTLNTNDQVKSFWELVYGSVNCQPGPGWSSSSSLIRRSSFPVTLQRIFNTCLKKFRLLFSAVISEHFSKNRVIISVVAAKIWYFKNVWFLLDHPVYSLVVGFRRWICPASSLKHSNQVDLNPGCLEAMRPCRWCLDSELCVHLKLAH